MTDGEWAVKPCESCERDTEGEDFGGVWLCMECTAHRERRAYGDIARMVDFKGADPDKLPEIITAAIRTARETGRAEGAEVLRRELEERFRVWMRPGNGCDRETLEAVLGYIDATRTPAKEPTHDPR